MLVRIINCPAGALKEGDIVGCPCSRCPPYRSIREGRGRYGGKGVFCLRTATEEVGARKGRMAVPSFKLVRKNSLWHTWGALADSEIQGQSASGELCRQGYFAGFCAFPKVKRRPIRSSLNGRIVNVFTNSVEEGLAIAVKDGYIVNINVEERLQPGERRK